MTYLILSAVFCAALIYLEYRHGRERTRLLAAADAERHAEAQRRENERERRDARESVLLNRIQMPQAAPFSEMETQVLSVDPNDDADHWAAEEEKRAAISG